MTENKYDSLFGKDRDWIEETLRDYDVPDGVIMQIGANIFVLQTRIDKMVAEQSNKRDIFAEIGREAQLEEEAKASYNEESIMRQIDGYFEGMIKADDDERAQLKTKRGKFITSLKHQLSSSQSTKEFIDSIWPEGMSVTYNLLSRADRRRAWIMGRSVSYRRQGENLLISVNGVEQSPVKVKEFLRNMKYDNRRQLLKKLLKNMQRKHDQNRK